MSGQDSELEEGEINGDDTFNEPPVIETTSSAFQDSLNDFKRHKKGQFTRSTLADRNYGRHSSSTVRYSKHNFKSKDNPRSSRQSTNKDYKKPAPRKSRNSSGGSNSWPDNSRPKEIGRHDDSRISHSSRKRYQESHRNRDRGAHKRSPRRSSHEAVRDKKHFPESAAKHPYKKSDNTYHETDHTKVIQKSSRRVVEIAGEWPNHDISPSKICRTISNDSYINKPPTTSSNANENNPRTVELQKENDFVDMNSYLKYLKGNSDPFRLNVSVDTQEPKVLVKPFSNDKDDEIIEIPVVKEKREPELIVIDSSDETEPDQDDGYEELELRKVALEGLFKNLKTKEPVEENVTKEVEEDLQALRSHLLADMANKTTNNQTQEIPNAPDNTHWIKTFKPVNSSLSNVQTPESTITRPAAVSTTSQNSTVTSISTTAVPQQSDPESSSTNNPLLRPFPRHWVDRKNPRAVAEIQEYLGEMRAASKKDYIASLMEAAKYDNMLPVVPSSKTINSSLSSTKTTISAKPSSYNEPPLRPASPRAVKKMKILDTATCRIPSLSIDATMAPFSNPTVQGLTTVNSVQTQSSVREEETSSTFNYEHVSTVPILQQKAFIPQSVSDFQGQPLFPRVSDATRFFKPPMHSPPSVRPPDAGLLGPVPTAFVTNSFQGRGLFPTPPRSHLLVPSSLITDNPFVNSDDMTDFSKQQPSQNTNRASSPFCFGQDTQLQVHSPTLTPQQRTVMLYSVASSPTMYINPNMYTVISKEETGLDPPKNSDESSQVLLTEKCVVNSLVKSSPGSSYHNFLSSIRTNGQCVKDEDDSSSNELSDSEVILKPLDTNVSRMNNEDSSVVANSTLYSPRVGNLIVIPCPGPEIENKTNTNKNIEPTKNTNICKIEKKIQVNDDPKTTLDTDPNDGKESTDGDGSFSSVKTIPIPRKKSASSVPHVLSTKTLGHNQGTKISSVVVKEEIMKSPSTTNVDVNNSPEQNVKDANASESAVVASTPLTPAAPIVTSVSAPVLSSSSPMSLSTVSSSSIPQSSGSSPMSSASVLAASLPLKLETTSFSSPLRLPTPLSPATVMAKLFAPITTVRLCGQPWPPIVNSSAVAATPTDSKQQPMSKKSDAVENKSPLSTSSISKNTVVSAQTTCAVSSSSSAKANIGAKFIPATSSPNQSNVIKGTEAYKRKLANYDNPSAVKRSSKFKTNNTNIGRKGWTMKPFPMLSKPMERILIALGDDSSSDEDIHSQISVTKDKANASGGQGSSSAAAPLPANFDVMLDAMLKSAREKTQRLPPLKSDEIINNSIKELKVQTEDTSNKSEGRTSKQSSSATSTLKPEGENAREKEELELRERLLRSTLMNKMKRSQTQLQLFSNEKKLVNTRATTTDMFQQLHSSMIKFKEKRNVVKDVSQKILNLRKQLGTEEKRLVIAKKSVNVVASEVKQRSVNAFRMRQVCLDLKKTCSTMGAEVSGPQYKLPVQGEAGLNAIVADVRKQTSIMKEFNESNVDVVLTPVGSPKPMPASNSSSNGLVSQLSTSSSSAVRDVSYVIDITPSNDTDPPHPQILVPSTRFLNVLGSSVSDVACGPPSRLYEALPCTFTEYESPLSFD